LFYSNRLNLYVYKKYGKRDVFVKYLNDGHELFIGDEDDTILKSLLIEDREVLRIFKREWTNITLFSFFDDN
jgi:hypothetical protein